jgi:mRNA interferase RelE/StbE
MYKVKYHKQVIKFLQKQNKEIAKRVVNFFDELKYDLKIMSNYDVKELKGLKNRYRLRVSKFGVIFSIINNELVIEVIKADSRGGIYK